MRAVLVSMTSCTIVVFGMTVGSVCAQAWGRAASLSRALTYISMITDSANHNNPQLSMACVFQGKKRTPLDIVSLANTDCEHFCQWRLRLLRVLVFTYTGLTYGQVRVRVCMSVLFQTQLSRKVHFTWQ